MKGITYQRKLFLLFSLAFLAVTLVGIILFYVYSSNMLIGESKIAMSQTSGSVTSKLDTLVNLMDVTSTQVIANSEVQTNLQQAQGYSARENFFDLEPEATKSIWRTLGSINSPLMAYGRIGIFNDRQDYISSGNLGTDAVSFRKNYEKQYAALLPKLDLLSDQKLLLSPHEDNWVASGDAQTVISLIREIRDIRYSSFRLIGYVEIQQPYYMLEKICTENISSTYQIVVLDAEGNVVYPCRGIGTGELGSITDFLKSNSAGGSLDFQGIRHLAVSQHSDESGWTTLVLQNEAYYLAPVKAMRNMLFLFSALFYFASFFLIFLISRSLTLPIRRLRDKVCSVSLENLSLDLPAQSNDEITLLSRAFDKTLVQLEQSVQQTIAANTREVNAHMLAMQAQMNPHFLFNTLMSISGIALQNKDEQIVSICSKLSEMLRYNASYREQNITMREELAYTRNFLELMQVRYGDFLSFQIDADEAVLLLPVPKLILQPIVENCFVHGFAEAEPPYRVEITGRAAPSAVTITVKDNGGGISERALAELRKSMLTQTDGRLTEKERQLNHGNTASVVNYLENTSLGGIGLMNIYLRLKMLWGDDLIFRIESDGGTAVTIGKRMHASEGGTGYV